MNIEQTYDDYLNSIESSLYQDEDETMERCPLCGDRYQVEEFDSYKGQRMCPECVDLERINDASEPLCEDFEQLFEEIGQCC